MSAACVPGPGRFAAGEDWHGIHRSVMVQSIFARGTACLVTFEVIDKRCSFGEAEVEVGARERLREVSL